MLKVENLGYGYTRSRRLFDSLSLDLKAGHIYGLLGRNGAGKTTLLRLMCGLLTPSSGVVKLNEREVKNREVQSLQTIFFLPEEFILPSLSPQRYADFYGKFYPRFDAAQFNSLLSKFEVDPTVKMHKLSFGQKKKAMISFALACNTDVVILDEPTNGLDIPSKSTFRSIVATQATENRIIIISTHQVRDLDQLIDSVVILDESKILLNEGLDRVGEKLRFGVLEDSEESLYCQPSPRGSVGVTMADQSDEESLVDLELLFNATVSARERISQLFNR